MAMTSSPKKPMSTTFCLVHAAANRGSRRWLRWPVVIASVDPTPVNLDKSKARIFPIVNHASDVAVNHEVIAAFSIGRILREFARI